MIRYIIVSIVSGILFGVMDGLINANPLAQKLYEVYKPITKTSLNVPAPLQKLTWRSRLSERNKFCLICLVFPCCDVCSFTMDDVQCADWSNALYTHYRIMRNACTWHTLWIDFETLSIEYDYDKDSGEGGRNFT